MTRLLHFSCGLPTDGEVISGMRRDVNVLIYLDVRRASEEGMKMYISDNRVILTEGFDGVVPDCLSSTSRRLNHGRRESLCFFFKLLMAFSNNLRGYYGGDARGLSDPKPLSQA